MSLFSIVITEKENLSAAKNNYSKIDNVVYPLLKVILF